MRDSSGGSEAALAERTGYIGATVDFAVKVLLHVLVPLLSTPGDYLTTLRLLSLSNPFWQLAHQWVRQ